MAPTSIKVDTGLRDHNQRGSARETWPLTVGEYPDGAGRNARRQERLQAMANAMRENPPDAGLLEEVSELDALTANWHVTEPAEPLRMRTGDVYWVRPMR